MPYIKQETRFDLATALKALTDTMKGSGYSGVGDCNYILTRILQEVLQPATYTEYNAAIGVLECCKLELYRRAVAIYEDKKVAEHGDVY